MKFTFKNATGRFQDSQIWFAIIGHKGAPFFRANLDNGPRATLVPCTPADNTVNKGGTTYANYFYSIDKVPTAELPEPLNSGRVWVAIGDVNADNPAPLYIRMNSPTDLAQPSVANPSLPNYNLLWDFLEFNYEGQKFYGNTSSVDAYAIPMTLDCSAPLTPSQVGYSANRSTVISAFQALGSPWSDLIIPAPMNVPLRIVNPQFKMPPQGIAPANFPDNYLSDYIDHCWEVWKDQKVTVQSPRGTNNLYTGGVDGSGNFVFVKNEAPNDPAYRHTIAKPPSQDVFACNGVFNRVGGPSPGFDEVDGDLKNQIASALNRTVLHNPSYDAWCQVGSFYTPWSGGSGAVTNLYAKTLHELSINRLSYAFAYDDQCNQSTTVKNESGDASSAEITITLTAF